MSLTSGSRLGPYEIVAPIGVGGMGEVYKAKDTRLDRIVAIKVISSLVAGTPEMRDRFEREARAVSQLNHPHICTLHDVGQEQGNEYLVLEFLDGESLAERLQRGPLPLEQATTIAIQICDALDKAHRAGIIHRDLKPGNVFLVRGATASAPPTAKLLDFGLAKSAPVAGGSAAGVNLTSPPTVTTPLTSRGTILGTFQYMAPEQLEGEEADARTDIWAFGCVLYEMLTGKKAFAGRTHASLISSIMSAQPAPVAEVVPHAPPVLDHVIRTCMAKDPAERFQTAHDLLLQLRWIAGGSGSQPSTATAGRSTRGGRSTLLFAGGLALAVIVSAAGTWFFTRPRPPAPQPAVRSSIDLPPTFGYGLFASTNMALSPDGKRLAYVAASEQSAGIRVRQLDEFGPGAPVPGIHDGVMPFFSPNGAWIGFAAGGKLQKVPVGGGGAVRICDLVAPMGAVWAPDDTIVFADAAKGVLMRIPSSGGQPTPITSLEKGEIAHRWPDLLPDGSVIFAANSAGTNWSDSRIVVQPADGSPRQTLPDSGTVPRYLTSGHIAMVRAGSLYVAPFDPRTRTTTGSAQQLPESIALNESDGRAQYTVANGTLVYAVAPLATAARTLVWVSRDGKVEPAGFEQRAYDHPRISPDGSRIALTIRGQNPDVWVADIERKTLTRFTFDAGEDESGVWTPDSQRVTYASSRGTNGRLTFWKAADGSGSEEEIFRSMSHHHLAGWTTDGRTLISEEVDGTFGLYSGTLGDKAVKPFLQTQFTESAAQLSPNGQWVAYSSNESGTTQVFVQAFPGPGSRQQISVDGGTEPKWARTGRELFYRIADRMMAVPVEYTPTLRAGTARVLFRGEFARLGWGQANYDVSSDGRFLMIQGEQQDLPNQLRLVVNWLDELRRTAPAK